MELQEQWKKVSGLVARKTTAALSCLIATLPNIMRGASPPASRCKRALALLQVNSTFQVQPLSCDTIGKRVRRESMLKEMSRLERAILAAGGVGFGYK